MFTFVLNVATGKEEEVKASLEAFPLLQGYRFWVPRRPIHKRKQGVTFLQYETLFPGYILADGEDFEELYKALLSFVSSDFYTLLEKRGEGGKTVSEEEKEVIRRLTGEVSRGILEGGRMRFVSGEMVGLEGFVQAFDKRKNNVKLRLELLGQVREIWTAVELVEPV